MKQIRFTKPMTSAKYGTVGPGDIVRCDDTFADHCVFGINKAVFDDTPKRKPGRPRRKSIAESSE